MLNREVGWGTRLHEAMEQIVGSRVETQSVDFPSRNLTRE